MSEQRLIDANALFAWGKFKLCDATKYGNGSKEQQRWSYNTLMMYEIADEIDDAPTINPPVRRGHWIEIYDGTQRNQKCSECGYTPMMIRNDRYCPDCGAYMRGDTC